MSKEGNDQNPGTEKKPLCHIRAAALRAEPGDCVTVHSGGYRERVDPPRGGLSDEKRITYRAAEGEGVAIKGSEILSGWRLIDGRVWMARMPNDLFGGFNPFANELRGDRFFPQGRTHHSGAVYVNGQALGEAKVLEALFDVGGEAWFAKSGAYETLVWVNPGDRDPNEELMEVNVRPCVFYPSRPGVNYLTVRGFTLSQAATPWSPPTTEQIGLIGVNWSKGWVIEENTVLHSRCTGLTLGKYFDREDGANEYGFNAHFQTVKRVLARGDWTREHIGHHLVKNNHIAFCGQAGIVGGHGGAFCTITGNVIHDIHTRERFSGFEQAGIKLHAPVDTEIRRNLIFNCNMGIWLDWMTQGARVSGNCLYGNREQDLFIEIGHGPCLVDSNVLLSPTSLIDSAQGGAYVHNLFGGEVRQRAEAVRKTPFFNPHSTEWAGEAGVGDGDERFVNNLFLAEGGLAGYDGNREPLSMEGNVFLYRSKPCRLESGALRIPEADNRFGVETREGGRELRLRIKPQWRKRGCRLVRGGDLGKTVVSGQGFEAPDGSPIVFDRDYFGGARNPDGPFPGPFECREDMETFQVWPPEDDVRGVEELRQTGTDFEEEPR
ncbi:MAG: right-handed parallel beta-helix repeat-containing protein [Kiritimatiellae bacterium]|nr:right-handed parallel beta-helix repeat-containing protein [Kiritimatiellia bacterium]